MNNSFKEGDLVYCKATPKLQMTIYKISASTSSVECRYFNQLTQLFEVVKFHPMELRLSSVQ